VKIKKKRLRMCVGVKNLSEVMKTRVGARKRVLTVGDCTGSQAGMEGAGNGCVLWVFHDFEAEIGRGGLASSSLNVQQRLCHGFEKKPVGAPGSVGSRFGKEPVEAARRRRCANRTLNHQDGDWVASGTG
jgi:hypothetical protein